MSKAPERRDVDADGGALQHAVGQQLAIDRQAACRVRCVISRRSVTGRAAGRTGM